jgi:uncharacterized coiled-coil protein SlyX
MADGHDQGTDKRLGSLEKSVASIATSVETLTRAVGTLQTNSRTQWGVVLTAAGVVILLAQTTLSPIRDDIIASHLAVEKLVDKLDETTSRLWSLKAEIAAKQADNERRHTMYDAAMLQIARMEGKLEERDRANAGR